MSQHPGRCGIHLFDDEARANAPTCDVCAWAVSSALADSKNRFTEDHSKAHGSRPASASSKATMNSAIQAHLGEKREKSATQRRAARQVAELYSR